MATRQRNPGNPPVGASWQITVNNNYTYFIRLAMVRHEMEIKVYCEDETDHIFYTRGGDSGSGGYLGPALAWVIGVHTEDMEDVARWLGKVILFTHDPDQDRPALCFETGVK